MTLTKQRRYLNPARNSFYILFPAKGIVSYRQIISSRLYVHKELIHSPAEHFQPPVIKINNVNVIYLKFPKSIAGRTKRSRGPHVAPGPRV